MSAELFTRVTGEYGGRRVRGVRINCCRCPATEWAPMNTIHDSKPRDQDEKLNRMGARKFEAAGWLIGHNTHHHICPVCRSAKAGIPKPAKHPVQSATPEKPTMQAAQTAIAKLVAAVPHASEQPPRQMGIDDALLIAGKLQEVYLGKDKGYGDDWSDGKVAQSLGVPRDWVKQVRQKSYGVDSLGGNDETAALVKDAQAVLKKAQEIAGLIKGVERDAIKVIESYAVPLRASIEAIDKRIAAVAKAMQ